MSTVKATWSQLSADGATLDCASNLSGDRFATSTLDGRQAYVQVWEPDSSSGDWNLVSQVSVSSPVTKLAWAHPESGLLLAGSTDSGAVYVIEAPRPGQRRAPGEGDMDADAGPNDEEEEREWWQSVELHAGSAQIRQLCFAPRQHGLLLSAASADGHVYVWEADRPLAPNSWCLQGKFQAVPKSAAAAGSSVRGCTSMAWRCFSPGVAPLIAVGTPQSLDLWQYAAQLMAWQRVATLPVSSSGPTTSVHWAPSLGRPVDLIAVAHGPGVDVFGLQGDTSAPQCELLATLQHGAPVWKVEFNMLGTCLACATTDASVCLWRPDFVGEWRQVSAVQGSAEAAEGEGGSGDGEDAEVD